MIQIRRKEDIYHKEGGWFSANWHFSFDEYRDSDWMSFGTMRVFNDDRLVPGATWPMHPHRDVEGLTYVVEGTFRHQDSLGNGGVFPAGSVQRMTLGSGAYHSEQNASETEPIRFIQIWIIPRDKGLPPSVEQKEFTIADRTDRLLRAIGPNREGGSILVHQDAAMYISRLNAGVRVEHRFAEDHGAYLFLIDGAVTLNDAPVAKEQAAVITEEDALVIEAQATSELIVVDVEV